MINNWLDRIKSKILPPRIAGLQLFISKEEIIGSAILMHSEKGNLKIDENFAPTTDWESLLTKIPKAYPIALVINGKGILHKSMVLKQDITTAANQLFPNIKQSDFYFQQTDLEQGNVISLVKHDLLQRLQDTINGAQLQLVSFSIGAFDLANLYLLNPEYQSYQGLNQELLLNTSGQISSFSNNSETLPEFTTYKFGSIEIQQEQLVGFAVGFNYLMEAYSSISFAGYEEQKKEYLFGQIYRLAIPLVLGFLLLIMVVNTFCYYQLKDSTQLGQLAMVNAQQQLEEVKDKTSTLKLQSKLFEETGANRISAASYYADRIGASLPKAIQLTELEIFPSKEKKKSARSAKDLIQYNAKLVQARGICKSSQVYNDWLKTLEAESWIVGVKHENFRDINTKYSEFLLTIELGELR